MNALSDRAAAVAPTQGWDRRHLLGLEGLSASDLMLIIEQARQFREVAAGRAPRANTLEQRTIANLFFEDSTRTRSSFTMAARRLGADTLDLTVSGSSVKKGETLVDTALNIQAMGVHAFVIRTGASGAPALIARAVRVPVINAGDGNHEHPTQGLLDLLTLLDRLKDLKGKTIAIVGDIASSRVARSDLHGLTTLGANVILVGPPTLVPRTLEKITNRADGEGAGIVRVHHHLDDVLRDVDAIIMLRVQFERAGSDLKVAHAAPPLQGAGPTQSSGHIAGDYRQLYGLTVARAATLKPHAIVLHPGPLNRGLEIDSEVADDPKRSVILQQVSNGVAIRMAVLSLLCG